MTKNLTRLMLMGFLALPLAVALPAQAATTWDTTGLYVISFDGYNHDMVLTQDGLGNLDGSGGYLAGNPYTYAWDIISGSVVGDVIHITADYTLGAIGTTMHIEGTIAGNGTMSGTWDDNYGGDTRVGTWSSVSGVALNGTLSAEDFGVVDYDTGLGQLRGYTSGFGLAGATLEDTASVNVKLYSGLTLLQTNTAIMPAFGALLGSQFSSPFDVSGSFNYVTDGYWTNAREAQYGQSVPATRVVATVTLENGKVLTAENTLLVGDPTTIYPTTPVDVCSNITGDQATMPAGYELDTEGDCVLITPPPASDPANKNECKKSGWKDFGFKNQGQCIRFVETEKDSR